MKVAMVDGPCVGRVFNYTSPLPTVLVVPTHPPVHWHDYRHTEINGRYRHASHCKCFSDRPPITELDMAVQA